MGKSKIMKYSILILILFFSMLSFSYAGENISDSSTFIVNESVSSIDAKEVFALEDGHLNTSFSDGSKGYCVEYGEKEAEKNDIFYKVNSDYLNNDGEYIGNYLKLYFVEYTSHAFSDDIVCQHMIWHFTDGFNGWRVNYTIVDEIKNSDKIIDDYYVQRLNETHQRVWFFSVLLSLYEHHQNYFSYIFYDMLIEDRWNSSNSTREEVKFNKSYGNYNLSKFNVYNNINSSPIIKEDKLFEVESNLKDKITGISLFANFYLLIFNMFSLLILRGVKKIKK